MLDPVALEFGLARGRDALTLAELARDHIETGLDWRWRKAEIRSLIADPDTVVLCARRQQLRGGSTTSITASDHSNPHDLAGFGAMRYEMDCAHLMLLAVVPELRRRGVGAHLLHWLERTALTAGIYRVELEVRTNNDLARSFYRRQGFKEREYLPGYYSGREAALRMEHRLTGTDQHTADPGPV